MQVTVLGMSTSWQDAGGACSGYLVEDGGDCVLLDCGSGVFSALRVHRDYVDVDAVVVSHMHGDHFLDLFPYACALTFAPRQQGEHPARPQLLLPPRATANVRAVADATSLPGVVERAFRVREYDVDETLAIGDLRVRFQPVPHYIATNAIEVASGNGGVRFTYGADHRPTDVLRDFAARTDLLILEATLPEPERRGPRGHMTPAEAGAHAAGCDAARLVLTHISDELDRDWALAQARQAYDGPIEIARPGAVYTL